jgi:signal transduction histidine kinase
MQANKAFWHFPWCGALPRFTIRKLSWWRSPLYGYPVSLLLVIVMTLAKLIVGNHHFDWDPIWIFFAIVTVIVGGLWGIGPALFANALGLIALSFMLAHGIPTLDQNFLRESTMLWPFVFAQLAIALLAARGGARYRQIVVAKQQIQAYTLELEQMNRQLEEAIHIKDEFMTRAAHELRTPLTTILGQTQLALRRLRTHKVTTDETALLLRQLERIEDRAHDLRNLTDALNDLSKLRSGEMPMQRTMCELGDLCRSIVAGEREMSGRRIELKLPTDSLMLNVDCAQLFQVILNVISNAIHYAPEDLAIQVEVCKAQDHALIQVHNDTPVLSQEQQERIFEPFYRGANVEVFHRDGWGLGLPISKEIVEHLGGTIRVTSTEKYGTTFLIELPLPQNP